jgi:hypothetical protein
MQWLSLVTIISVGAVGVAAGVVPEIILTPPTAYIIPTPPPDRPYL